MEKTTTIFLSFLAFFFFVNTNIINAQVVINEVQTAPIAERFIELYNTGNSDIDLTGWYVQRKTATGSKFGSLVTSPKFENKTIKAGGYFLISRNALADSDIVIGNMTLTNSNTLRLRNSNGEDVDKISWGSLNEGESYQKTANGWISATPTPATPHLGVRPPSGQSSGNSSAKTDSQQQQKQQQKQKQFSQPVVSGSTGSSWPVEPQIFTRVKSAPSVAVVGADILIEGEALGLVKKPLSGARYLWTFGDGGTKEGKKVFYRYDYPGKYVVILNASSGKYSASDRVTIEAIPADVEISAVGTGTDSFVEIYNKTKYELNLSWWRLRLPTRSAQANMQTNAGSQLFTIPKDTIILPYSKIIFPPQHTEFKIIKNEKIELLYPNGTTVTAFTWGSDPQVNAKVEQKPIVAPPPAPAENVRSKDRSLQTLQTTQTKSTKKEKKEKKEKVDKVEETVEKAVKPDISDISGEQQSANVFTASSSNKNDIYKWILATVALAVVSMVAVLFTGSPARGAQARHAQASAQTNKIELSVNKESDLSSKNSVESDEYEIIEDKN